MDRSTLASPREVSQMLYAAATKSDFVDTFFSRLLLLPASDLKMILDVGPATSFKSYCHHGRRGFTLTKITRLPRAIHMHCRLSGLESRE